jgi:endonuclease/exonuclease/phosphatase family metal-dependent hydrolase
LISIALLTACAAGEAPTPAATAAATAAPSPTPFPRPDGFVLDGFFDDWAGIPPLYVDAAGDAGASGVDFTEIYAAHNDTHLFLALPLGKNVNLQSESALHLTIQSGGDEITFDFGERTGQINGGTVTQAEIGLTSLPTVTADRFEIAIPFPAAPGAELRLLIRDPGAGGDTASPDGQPLAYGWSQPLAGAPPLELARPPGALRLLTWNVLTDNLFNQRDGEHFARVLQALQPDIVLLQEVYVFSDQTALNRLTTWLGGMWYARQQGDLVTISRYPFIEGWREGVTSPDSRLFPALLDMNGAPLLIINAHLSCCDDDQNRQHEVDSLIRFLREVNLPPGTPLILAGDLNLVGDPRQLDTLLTGNILDEIKYGADFPPDGDHTPLADLLPRHLLTPFAHTWRDPASQFQPGRLDYILYSDSLLNARGFVFDTSELPADLLAALGIQAGDTAVSDHLPLVVDFVIVPQG